MAERLATLARRLVENEQHAELLERDAKRARDDADAAERAFWDALDDQGMTTTTLDLGHPFGKVQFQKRETIRGNILDKARAIDAIKDERLDDSLLESYSIRRKPLNDLIRQRLREGRPLPNGVDFSTTRYVTISRRKES